MYKKRYQNCQSCGNPLGRNNKWCGSLTDKLGCAYKVHLEKQNKSMRKRYQENPRHFIEYSAKWLKKHPEKVLEYRNRRKEKQATYYGQWYAQNGRKRTPKQLKSIKIWQKENPEKVKACNLLNYAIQSGKLIKPELCQGCFEKRRLHGHHEDYSKPYDVIWVCASCHKNYHLGKLELKIS